MSDSDTPQTAGAVATPRSDAACIVRDRRILGGEPTIKGTRSPVRSIVQTLEIYGDLERVGRAYPSLTPADIQAALDFYNQNRDEIRRYITENEAEDD